MKTTLTRSSEVKFTKTLTRQDGKVMEINISKGSTEYSNACSLFHKNNIEIAIGNSIEM